MNAREQGVSSSYEAGMEVLMLADPDEGHSSVYVLISWEAGFLQSRVLVCYIASPVEWFATVYVHQGQSPGAVTFLVVQKLL